MRFTKFIAGFGGNIAWSLWSRPSRAKPIGCWKRLTSIAAPNPEAIARIVATGEEVATAFLTLELDRFGIPAQVLDPSQIQLIAETTSNDTEPVSAELSAIDERFRSGQSRRHSRLRGPRSSAVGSRYLDAAAPTFRLCSWPSSSTRAAASSRMWTASTTAIPQPAPTPSASMRSGSPMRSDHRRQSRTAESHRLRQEDRCSFRGCRPGRRTTRPRSAAIVRSCRQGPIRRRRSRLGCWVSARLGWESSRSYGNILTCSK